MAVPDHVFQFAAEPRVLEHLQVGVEDGGVLLAQFLGDGVAVAGNLGRRGRDRLFQPVQFVVHGIGATNRRGMRNPSLSMTSASPMAIPGETAIPCSFCMRFSLTFILRRTSAGKVAPIASTAAWASLPEPSSDNCSPWAAPSVITCNMSVASTSCSPWQSPPARRTCGLR